MSLRDSVIPLDSMAVSSYTIPTDRPESDGTLEWDATTLILVELAGGGQRGLGYGYADTATARLIDEKLKPLLQGQDALSTNACWQAMARSIRNLGRPGICAMAISTVDAALWDLKAKCLGVSLASLLGRARSAIPVYGSGGFTSYTLDELRSQLGQWAKQGIGRVKMKVGRQPDQDPQRVAAARDAVGEEVALFVDANGAYTRKQALALAERYAQCSVTWFEEPVSSDDLAGLHLLRNRAPAGMAITAGEYGYELPYFRRMLEAQAVDVLQADATRCGGITGFLGVAALCEAANIPLSSHCAPSLHAPLCCAARPAIHLEYFHDHVRIEHMLFDGAPELREGMLVPSAAPGLGLAFKAQDAERYQNP